MALFDAKPYAGKRVCVALSGGRDSVALLHAFFACADAYDIALSALTCEHGIRGETSRRDLAFVQELCAQYQIPLTVFQADIPARAAREGRGLEETGRIWRYECFQAQRTSGRADVIATAHHRDDYAETILFRLLRGTSLAGLNAFPQREGIVRPLLHVSRAQIDDYIKAHALPFVEDETNADERFTRNLLRISVFPVLEEALPGAAEHLVDFAERVRLDDDFLFTLAREGVREAGETVRVSCALPDPIFTRACLLAIKRQGTERDYTSANIAELAKLRSLQSGRRVNLPGGRVALRDGQDVLFFLEHPRAWEGELPFALGTLDCGGEVLVVGEGERADALFVDLDAFPAGCVVRTRREGDTFAPFGGGRKSLKKFLTEKKIAAWEGRTLPLVACGSEVLAVCGVEIAARVKITEKTVRRGYLYTPARAPKSTLGGNK